MDIKERVHDLYDLVNKGQVLEAFDKYYADDVSMQENEKEPMVGKAANRAREKILVDGLTSPLVIKILSLGIGDDVSIVEQQGSFTHKDWGASDKVQVAVQHWKDGKIAKEKFYYAT